MASMALSLSAQKSKKSTKKSGAKTEKVTKTAKDSKTADDKVMTKNKGVYVVNTTTLCQTKGFGGPTPLMVTIKNDVIQSVEALSNKETPQFFQNVTSEMLPKYKFLKIDKHAEVDAITGATFSSRAVKANVKAAVEYYKVNK